MSDNDVTAEKETYLPMIGQSMTAKEVIEKGERVGDSPIVYELEYENCTIQAELHEAVITQVEEHDTNDE